jgi:hypothetical protein
LKIICLSQSEQATILYLIFSRLCHLSISPYDPRFEVIFDGKSQPKPIRRSLRLLSISIVKYVVRTKIPIVQSATQPTE